MTPKTSGFRRRPRPSLWDALAEYNWELTKSALAPKSVEDYYYFAAAFVRWMEGEFKPGENVSINGTVRRRQY